MKSTKAQQSVQLKAILIFLLLVILQFANAQIGHWSMSSKNLPVYTYTGKLPFSAKDKNGNDANLPEDPYFMIGNYRMKLFTHASGIYQLITGERAWARINAEDKRPNYGWNEAGIVFKNNRSQIISTGLNSVAATASVQKTVGVGFARYDYNLENGIKCTRILSTKPSQKINKGNPSFIITVLLENTGTQTQVLTYTEKMLVNQTSSV